MPTLVARGAGHLPPRPSLIRVKWPPPLDFSQSRTRASRRTLTATFRRTSRIRTMLANCSSVRRGMSSRLRRDSSPAAWRVAAPRSTRRSFSVHRLFLISSDFMLFRPTGRDDADDFFATIVLSVCVNNQQHYGGLSLNTHRADCVPASLSCFVYAVRTNKAALVIEDQGRQLE